MDYPGTPPLTVSVFYSLSFDAFALELRTGDHT